MKRYEVCARGYAWLAERESADGLWVKYDEAAAECDELRQQLTKANTMLLFTRAERDSLQQQLAAAQERNVALQSEHLNHVNALHEQLTAMTAERDSESRWAKHYSDKVTELEQQLAAMQRIIDSYRRII